MPRLVRQTPRYRKHRSSGQAIVELDGRRFYLGPHGTKASHAEYDRLVGEWLQNGRQLQADPHGGMTVVELIAAYCRFARRYYQKDNRSTGEFEAIVAALRPVKQLYARRPAVEFGPVALRTVIGEMLAAGWTRGTINRQASRVKRMFRWGVSRQFLPAESYQALTTVDGLRKGRCEAPESKPVGPVSDADVDATLAHLPDVPADMVRMQRLTGCRPAEVCAMRPCDIDRTADPWRYTPKRHKTEHAGRQRVIFVGPKAKAILLRYLARGDDDSCFQPRDSEAKRRAAASAARVVPLSCGNRPGTNRVRHKRRRAPRERYEVDAYRRAIHRACDKAKIPRWSPNRLRHTAATEIRQRYGLEAAQVVLGHSKADITQVYAERDLTLAARVAQQIG